VTATDVFNLVVGVLELALAGVVLLQLGRFGRAFPWLAALTAFFAVRGADRVYVAFAGPEPVELALVANGFVVLVLVLLLVGVERTAMALRLAQEEAEHRRDEYARALAHYRVLARHRLANPITAIRGGIATLKALPDLDRTEARRMLELVDAEAERLEHLALDPRPIHAEERALRPQPDV
jgi:signal transduction histidine kinase